MMRPPPPGLLGPPGIDRSAHPPLTSDQPSAVTCKPVDAAADGAGFSMSGGVLQPLMGRTENNSATYLSSGNPCLDFFFQVVPDTPSGTVAALLAAAWEKEPLMALKLVCHLRGVRGTGKSDREGLYASALWLHKRHPKTLALNVASFAEFGYMKDLLEILFRLLDGPDTRKLAKEQHERDMASTRKFPVRRAGISREQPSFDEKDTKLFSVRLAEIKIANRTAGGTRKQKREALALRALHRYGEDQDYRFLHDCIAEFFAGLLASDVEQLRANELRKIGLAAKWCPTPESSFDRTTLICESIARRMFPRDSNPEYEIIAEEHYVYRVRTRLRREVLVPLRQLLELPEVYMSACRWDSLPYNRVASVAMKRYKDIFKKHDEARFNSYLEEVKEGKATIAAGALLPHEILAPAYVGEHDEVAELQWRRMVEDMSQAGKLTNCIAVCDVSGSMTGKPMEVCIALGLLVSDLSERPWNGHVITFSSSPELHIIKGETLTEKASFVKSMDWGMNTDFRAVFDRILRVAVEGRLPPEKMVRRVFVFSDMEFDQASTNDWETDYNVIRRKFNESGYGSAVPEIVFWNLRDSRSTPVTATQNGVALVSGFSKNLLKIFLEGDGVVNPEAIMEAAIAGEEYQKLVVYD